MKSLWLKIACAALCLTAGYTGGPAAASLYALEAVPSAPAPDEPEADPAATSGPAAGSELFITYVYATERTAAWTDYALAVAKSAKQAEVLGKFGLAGIDEVQTLQEAKKSAMDELRNQKLQSEAARQAIAASYAGAADSAAADIAVPPEPAAQLKQALLGEKAARQALQQAELQIRSGALAAAEEPARQLAYLQARLNVIDMKQAYCQSVLAALMESGGGPVTLTAFAGQLGQLPEMSELGEWHNLLAEFAIRPFPAIPASEAADAIPRYREQEGERFVPLRPYADAAGYQLEWLPDESRILLSNAQHTVILTLHDTQAQRGEQVYTLAGAPYVHSGYTYVPLSLFSGLLGVETHWSEDEGQAIMILPRIGEVELP